PEPTPIEDDQDAFDPSEPLVDQALDCLKAAGGELTDENIAEVLSCFDRIRDRQDALDESAADDLRSSCADDGGEACTELMLRSPDEEDQLFGLACGGRSPEIPCPGGSVVDDAAEAELPPEPESAAEPESAPAPVDPTDATVLDQAVRGNVILYAISEIDRPIYGWKDFITVAYCLDGRFFLRSDGERRTVLDNTEYRSDQGEGTWQTVDVRPGTAAIELFFNDGRRNGFVVGIPSFDHGPAINAGPQGPADC
ncbi:MAG: hypothetical protein ACR2QO_17550, partial [Acidimicrobiales bacterium]